MERVYTITDPKPPGAKFFVEIDLTEWLDTEDISSVAYAAKNMETGETVTSTVLDAAKNTNTAKILKPFIQAGSDNASYCVTMTVTTDETPASIDEFYVIFSVEDNLPKIGPL